MDNVTKKQINDIIAKKRCINSKEIAALLSSDMGIDISESLVLWRMRKYRIKSHTARCKKVEIINELLGKYGKSDLDWILKQARIISCQRVSALAVTKAAKVFNAEIIESAKQKPKEASDKAIKNYIVRIISETSWISDGEISAKILEISGESISPSNIRRHRVSIGISAAVKRVGIDSIIAIEMESSRTRDIKEYRELIFDRTGYKITKKEIEESMYRAGMRPLIQEIDSMLERRPHFEDVDILFNLNKKSEWSEVTKPEVKWVLKHLKSDYR